MRKFFSILAAGILSLTTPTWAQTSFSPDEAALKAMILSVEVPPANWQNYNWRLLRAAILNLSSMNPSQRPYSVQIEDKTITHLQFTPAEDTSDSKVMNFSADLELMIFQTPRCNNMTIHLKGQVIAPKVGPQYQNLDEFTVSPDPEGWQQCV